MGQTISQCTRARQQGFGFRNVNRQHAQVIYYSVKLGTVAGPCQQEFLKYNWIHGEANAARLLSGKQLGSRRVALEIPEDHVCVHKHKRRIPDRPPAQFARVGLHHLFHPLYSTSSRGAYLHLNLSFLRACVIIGA